MNATSLMLSLLFGCIGMGFVMYAKNAGKVVPVIAGLGLMIIPYFISSIGLLLLICIALTAVPFIFRDA